VILSDDDSIDDDKMCWQLYGTMRRWLGECRRRYMDGDCCNEVDTTDNCFHSKRQDKVE